MKRPKIMLTAIAILAVVGGALAVKATKLLPNSTICTSFVEGGVCHTDPLINRSVQFTAVTNFYYTPKPAGVACSQTTCPRPGQVIIN